VHAPFRRRGCGMGVALGVFEGNSLTRMSHSRLWMIADMLMSTRDAEKVLVYLRDRGSVRLVPAPNDFPVDSTHRTTVLRALEACGLVICSPDQGSVDLLIWGRDLVNTVALPT
jgi:hypothetical protein